MNKEAFNCELEVSEYITRCASRMLYPENYLDIDDEEELIEVIRDDLWEYLEETYNDIENLDTIIPNKFLEKWKSLKSRVSIEEL